MKNNLLRRAWIYFMLAVVLIFTYYSDTDNRNSDTLDEFSLMAIGASLAFGFSALSRFLKEKRNQNP